MPCRSGSPHGVRGSCWPVGFPWPATVAAARITIATVGNLRLFLEIAIHQLFDKLYALVFEELRVFLHAAIERHAHLPRARKDLWILDGDVVLQHVAAHRLDRKSTRLNSSHVEISYAVFCLKKKKTKKKVTKTKNTTNQ